MSAELAGDLDRQVVLPAPVLGTVPLHAVRPRGGYETRVKPLVDVLVGVTAFALLLPVMLVVGAAVALEFGRPVLFTQQRVGRDGREFVVYKFRTMRHDRRRSADHPFLGEDRRRTHKSDDDPRHTRLGRLLRRTSLDELPQLWNVVRGDMSLVGPRPELVQIVRRYEPWQHRRHDVKPGLTGLWQVSARGERPMHEATEIDLRYVDSISAWTDLKILASTPVAVLVKRSGS